MDFNIETFLNSLDFEDYDYFYHQTNQGSGDSIIENGLLIEGSNIIDTDNLLYTTAIELKESDITDLQTFLDFLKDHQFKTQFRDTLEMVFIAIPKEYKKNVVTGLDQYIDGIFYRALVEPLYILGYINVLTQEITINKDCEFYIDPFFL